LWARADQSVTHIGLHKYASRFTDAAMQPRITVTRGTPQKVMRGQIAANGKGANGGKAGNGAPKPVAARVPPPPKAEKAEPDER
jgi:hypothetical protein